ncbi:glycoside hydrolase family 13 protein [Saliphagus infecundisoli]|uniref:Alpha-glucosidase n=1 Tax=Saliphagus infecundisoli TaxID=1849069 RepID=A0ABD5QJG6_9EURY|nr:alpha-glucosidase [Saliphagus infecundisoli]
MTPRTADAAFDRQWWKEAIVYQIYPRSFNDSDGDGIGDLRGIVEKVDYLDDLGVDVVWLCPVYDSPMADNGYDIRDFRSIADTYGSVDDWERLRDVLHERGIRLVMDLVLNHTSDEHEWFRRSRREEDGYADYYHWREGEPDEPPNNWESIFGGPAWSYDEARGEWYLHLFDEKQPDLNWRTPAVREEMKAVVEWWLERGIDGFRMDAVSHMSKTDGLPDGDPSNSPVGAEHYSHGPRLESYLAELNADVLSAYDAMTVAEMGMTTVDQAADYVNAADNGIHMVFQFDHLDVGGHTEDWEFDDGTDGSDGDDAGSDAGGIDLPEFKRVVTEKQRELDWDAIFLGNHDVPRIVSQFGTDSYRERSATLLGTFLLTMRGTPYIYQGEEIGMTNTEFESLDALDDPKTVGRVEALLEDGVVDSFEEVAGVVNARSRDHARTPMQWSDDPHAGFTGGEPWLPANENYPAVNVGVQRSGEESVLAGYRRLIDLRQRFDVLVYGDYELLAPDHEQVYAYVRTGNAETVLVVLNWSASPAHVPDLDVATDDADLLFANAADAPADPSGATLQPYGATVYLL